MYTISHKIFSIKRYKTTDKNCYICTGEREHLSYIKVTLVGRECRGLGHSRTIFTLPTFVMHVCLKPDCLVSFWCVSESFSG